jgi:hypothetical protein
MSNPLAALSTIDELAYLTGLFDWQMENGSYTNPNTQTVAFHVITNQQIPGEQYIEGAINIYEMLGGSFGSKDPNTSLFNTQLTSNALQENVLRKHTLNRVPFANYDQPVDLGVGSQRLVFNVVFAGTMYQTAMRNVVQVMFNNQVQGLGTLHHPFYGKIKNVLPISFNTKYDYTQLNVVICELTFLTSDITHLMPNALQTSILAEIGFWFIGIQNAVTSIGGTLAAAQGAGALGAQLGGQL